MQTLMLRTVDVSCCPLLVWAMLGGSWHQQFSIGVDTKKILCMIFLENLFTCQCAWHKKVEFFVCLETVRSCACSQLFV